MNQLHAYLDAVSVIGPGLPDWASTREILLGRSAYTPAPSILPAPGGLPPAERRRVGKVVKIALAVGDAAVAASGLTAATLPTVFSASDGDGDNCHDICQTLASDDRLISPTRFHNSVHNAAAGYWSISAKCMATSTSLCAFDATFAAGLLEAAAQVASANLPCLLIAYDSAYPEPIRSKRPIPDAMGIGLLLSPERGANSIARLSILLTEAAPTPLMDGADLENLRAAIPVARGLPFLAAVAKAEPATVIVDYLDNLGLAVRLEPCS